MREPLNVLLSVRVGQRDQAALEQVQREDERLPDTVRRLLRGALFQSPSRPHSEDSESL